MKAAADRYTALIRTFNSAETLPRTLASLENQSCRPARHVFVDSGSTDSTKRIGPSGSIFADYEGSEYNYSRALNQGIRLVETDFILIVSSHTTLENPLAMKYAINLLNSQPSIGAAYFSTPAIHDLSHELIDGRNFDGFNGLWNTCSVLRTRLVTERPFRPEVFSAEDQEWAAWAILKRGFAIARIAGAGMRVHNPSKHSMRKRLNEHVAVACFIDRRQLELSNLRKLAKAVIGADGNWISREERLFRLLLLLRLLACRFTGPRDSSGYF